MHTGACNDQAAAEARTDCVDINTMSNEKARQQRDGDVTKDSRFAAMHRDPRFSRFPTKKGTVEIDSRFSGKMML